MSLPSSTWMNNSFLPIYDDFPPSFHQLFPRAIRFFFRSMHLPANLYNGYYRNSSWVPAKVFSSLKAKDRESLLRFCISQALKSKFWKNYWESICWITQRAGGFDPCTNRGCSLAVQALFFPAKVKWFRGLEKLNFSWSPCATRNFNGRHN